MKTSRLVFVLVSLCVGIGLVLWWSSDTKQTSTTTQLTVVQKFEKDQKLWIKGYNSQKNEVQLLVKDQRIWNEMLINKTYFLTYLQKENEEPIFVELVPEQ